ncbi:unnamed protein product [Amoebophrya sp. A25]|nr:unnamed protein product [Amoebophrya sp. A25]|eukprot:GSA25T00010117001.1
MKQEEQAMSSPRHSDRRSPPPPPPPEEPNGHERRRDRSPRRSKWDTEDNEDGGAKPGGGLLSSVAVPKMNNSMFRDMLNDPSLYGNPTSSSNGGDRDHRDYDRDYDRDRGRRRDDHKYSQGQGYGRDVSRLTGNSAASSSTAPSSRSARPNDPNINPLTNTPYSKKYFEILEKRQTLPCAAARKDFLKLVKKNQVTVLVGETGSGKTTQMPQFILDAGYASFGKAVACTQPRRVAAMSVAQRVADEMDVELGTYCGYSIRFEDRTSKDTLLKYMTDGMLLREAMTEPTLSRYSVIILDEAHERTLATDVLFGLLKEIMKNREDLKIVVMSATLDAEKMQLYFNNAPMINIPGRTFPVEIYYTPEPEKDYLQAAIRTVLMIHNEEPDGDVLLFLTGEEEIEYACRTLMSSARSTDPKIGELRAIALYSSLPPHMQQRIFEPAPKPRIAGGRPGRKIVVSTNIAETSVTIDGIVYVVDPGLSKQKVFNPRIKVESLLVTPISQASASQRSGRAGRTRPGKCFRLYTENSFKELLTPQTYPEILRSNLSTIVLTLLKLGIQDLVHFDFLDPPAPETLMHALNHLRNLGALSNEMQMTSIGRLMSEFPLDANHSRMLLSSPGYHCSHEIISIVAMLSVPQVFHRGKEKEKQEAERAKQQFAHMDGDHLQLLQVFDEYRRQKELLYHNEAVEQWCQTNYVNMRSLQSAESVRGQLASIMEKNSVPVVGGTVDHQRDPQYHARIRKAILAGCYTNVARLQADGKHKDKYLNVQDNQAAEIHPSTCLKHKPEWIVFNDIVLTQKNYVRTATKILPEWCLEISEDYFSGKLQKLPQSVALRELEDLKRVAGAILQQQAQQYEATLAAHQQNLASQQMQQLQAEQALAGGAGMSTMQQHMQEQQLLQQKAAVAGAGGEQTAAGGLTAEQKQMLHQRAVAAMMAAQQQQG